MSAKDSGLKSTVTQDFRESDGKCQHRLRIAASGEATAWATYTQYTYLRGYVGVTAYHNPAGEVIISAEDFLLLTAVR